MREAGWVSFSPAIIEHLAQKQLEGKGFILDHRLQSTTERSQGRNSRPWRKLKQRLWRNTACCLAAACLLSMLSYNPVPPA